MPIWAPLLLGYWAAGGRETDLKYPLLLLFGLCLGGWVYGLNQIFDIEGDRINRKNLPLPLGLVTLKSAWAISIASAGLAAVIGFLLGIFTGVFVLLGLAMGYFYSHPRFRFKDKAWPALILNGLGHGSLVYLIGWAAGGPLAWMMLIRMLPYALAYAGVYIATAIPDIEGDRATGKNTLAVELGGKRSIQIALGLIGIGSISGILLSEPALFLTGLFALPFYIAVFIRKEDNFVRANQIAVLLLNIWICFYIFSYFIVLLAVIILSRLYYTKRIGVNYP